jgi:hypothetical protein
VSAPHIAAHQASLTAALVVFSVAAAALTCHCLIEARVKRTWIPIVALLGAVIALPTEPFWDVNVRFTFAANSHPVALTAFGRHIPLYVALAYTAFIGWGSYIGYVMIRAGRSRRVLLTLPAGFALADAAIEITGTQLQLWVYYGHQPLTIARWPVLFGFLNGTITLLGGALLAALEPRLAAWRKPMLVLAVPTAYAGIYAVAGWPMWVALGAHVPRFVSWLAGLASVGICVFVALVVADAVGALERGAAASTGALEWPVEVPPSPVTARAGV